MRQVNCNLGKQVPGKAARQGLAHELGINPSQMHLLCDENWTTLARADLHQLLLWWDKKQEEKEKQEQQENDREAATPRIPLFEVVPSPIWTTFSKNTVLISKGNTQYWDGQVDAHLRPALIGRGCEVESLPPIASIGDARKRMESSNCIFIGSPKRSTDCDLAISALYEDAGFVPFRFMVVDSMFGRQSKIVETTDNYGRAGVYLDSGTHERHLKVDWRSEREFRDFHGHGIDAGVLVVCRRPFNTVNEVATVILAGYSGFGTYAMCEELVNGRVHVDESELMKRTPVMRIMRAAYKKEGEGDTSRVSLARGSRWFAPPLRKRDWILNQPSKGKQNSVSET